METAIIILNYNTWKETIAEIELCVNVLNANIKDVIVVDNCSANDSGEQLEMLSHDMGFVFIQAESNNGYACGNNIGLRYAYQAGYQYALVINNDIIIEDGTMLDQLKAVLQKDSRLAVVSPDIYSPSGYLFNRDAKRPGLFDFTLGLLRYKQIGRAVQDIGGYGYVYRPQGCCMLVNLSVLNAVDYLDEATFLYCEEIILAERLRKHGYGCACCMNTNIIHNHSTTVKSTFAKSKIRKMKNKSFSYYLKTYRQFNFIEIQLCCLFNTLKLMLLGE